MGCGSSTTVQTFSNEENRNYQNDNNQTERKSSATASVKSAGKRPKSTSPSSASVSSTHPTPKRTDVESRVNSGSTRKTYTITRENSVPIEDQFQHEELQKETFLTGNYRRQEKQESPFGDFPDEDAKESREDRHDRRAREIEAKLAGLDYEKQEEDDIADLELEPISFPPMDSKPEPEDDAENREKEYTCDHILAHNAMAGFKEWFKYGRKVYNASLMLTVIKVGIVFKHTIGFCSSIKPK